MKKDPIINAKALKIVEAIKNSNVYHRYEGINKCTLEKRSDEILPDEPLECSCDYYERLTTALASLGGEENHPSEREVFTIDEVEDLIIHGIDKGWSLHREEVGQTAEGMGVNYVTYQLALSKEIIDRYLAEKQSKTE